MVGSPQRRNMRSIRCVTRKPPAMLIDASRMAAAPRSTTGDSSGPLTSSMPPTTMMPLTALVTLMSGVCSAGVTFQITCQPTTQASANTVRWPRKAGGATNPSATSAAAIFGPPEFIQHLTVFLLACVVGWHVIWNVTPALHTPLMSVTNAISGIIVIGGMLALYSSGPGALILGGIAVLIAAINVAGGFLVTQRMLKMFRK